MVLDFLIYTKRQIEKHWALLEDHFLWAIWNKADRLCYQCIWNHLLKLEGYCEEAFKFDSKTDNYKKMLEQIEILRKALYTDGLTEYLKYAIVCRKNKLSLWEETKSKEKSNAKKT